MTFPDAARRALKYWVASLVITLLLRFDVPFPINLLLLAIVGAVGIAVAVWLTALVILKRRRRETLDLVVCVLVWGLWQATPMHSIGAYVKTVREMSGYERSIAQIKSMELPECKSTMYGCRIDNGPPLRVAFVWGGLLDNWYGVVFDPSGEVLDVRRTAKVFGGDLVESSRLWGSWYLCSFT